MTIGWFFAISIFLLYVIGGLGPYIDYEIEAWKGRQSAALLAQRIRAAAGKAFEGRSAAANRSLNAATRTAEEQFRLHGERASRAKGAMAILVEADTVVAATETGARGAGKCV